MTPPQAAPPTQRQRRRLAPTVHSPGWDRVESVKLTDKYGGTLLLTTSSRCCCSRINLEIGIVLTLLRIQDQGIPLIKRHPPYWTSYLKKNYRG